LHVAVGGVQVLQLGVSVRIQGFAHISCDPVEESFPDGPFFTHALPFLFHLLSRVHRSGVVNGWIIWAWFRFLLPHKIHELLVFILAVYFRQEAVFFARGGSSPIVRDIFQFPVRRLDPMLQS